jgi:hypothetical protein
MGINTDATAPPISTPVSNTAEEGVFSFRVVEHISWDSYDEGKKCFLAGHKNNKPIAGRKFKIKMPDGSVITETTDKNGVIKISGTKENDKFEVIFEPGSEESKEKHNIFYNKSAPVKKVDADTLIVKSDLLGGGDHQLSILRFTVIIDSHMHIQSARCAPIKWVQNLTFLTKGMQRKTIEGIPIKAGYFIEFFNIAIPLTWFFKLPFTGIPIRELPEQGKRSTRESGDDFIENIDIAYENYFKKQKLYSGLSRLFMPAVVMTMDMEYAHIDGYYGLKIYNPLYETKDTAFINSMQTETKRDKVDGYDDLKIYKAMYKDKDEKIKPKGYWFPVHGKWVKTTELVNLYPYETMAPQYDAITTQHFEEIGSRNETRYVKISDGKLTASPIDIEDYKQNLGKDKIEVDAKIDASVKKSNPFLFGSYFDANEKKTKLVKVEAAPVLASKQEVIIYEQWERQLLYTEISALKYPLRLLPMFHYDPRRWQTYGINGNTYPLSQVTGDGLYIGFKMYTAQGYKPLDTRLPIMEEFYVKCCNADIPIMNHGTPGGASTYEKKEYLNFYHLNDSAGEKHAQKQEAQANCNAEEYFDEHYVSPHAWEKLLEKEITIYDENGAVSGKANMKNLRLCLAHFGGPSEKGMKWNQKIIEMICSGKYPNLYTDISSSFASDDFRTDFQKIIADPKNVKLKDHILFGTDWYMSLMYTPPFSGKTFRQYCEVTKGCLDEVDRSLWPRFTQINPFNFYRLDKKIETLAENIIKKRADEDVLNFLKELDSEKIAKIRTEAAFLKVANKDYVTIKETPITCKA